MSRIHLEHCQTCQKLRFRNEDRKVWSVWFGSLSVAKIAKNNVILSNAATHCPACTNEPHTSYTRRCYETAHQAFPPNFA